MKELWEMTFREFQELCSKNNPDPIPEIVQDGWIHHVTKALKEGKPVPQSVLKSHSEIHWEGNTPCWNAYIPWRDGIGSDAS